MNEDTTPSENKTDPVDVRAAEVAKRDGRTEITDTDREKAFTEMQTTAPEVKEVPADD
ncbi:hypothetical protein [Phragmitibacter flavus]|uniref:hypothetical protein n=1 Tax=Phragmitibacter flavus TaxID=2576071 RepID=UPI00140B8E21|nr:hypothetical protein [Phragmitibacter flavus]